MYWIHETEIPTVAKDCAEILRKHLNKHPNTTAEVIADVIQAGIEGWIQGTQDRLNRAEMDMEDD